jgi:flagellar hook-associated protein 1 FlgK
MSGSLNAILTNATSGLTASQAGLAVVSNNVANAGVANYTTKQQQISTFEVGDQAEGVRTGLVSRTVDAAVQATVFSAASSVGALTVRSSVLQSVNNTQGTPDGGVSLGDAVSGLQSSFTDLLSQPSNTTQQSAVVAAAQTLATSINTTANEITAQRNTVQSQIVEQVGTLNTALATIQSTTNSIVAATATGTSTANLEDERDTALQTLSSLLNVSYSKQPDGNVTILGQNGFSIPLDATFSTSTDVLTPQSSYAGGSVPDITMTYGNGPTTTRDVTTGLSGGSLGELVQLRDTTLPGYTSQLDSFSAQLANAFSDQGLQLFTDGNGTATTLTATAGLSSQIQVNAAVTADPTLVVNGTPTDLNTNNVAGFTGVISDVLNNTFAPSGATNSLATTAQNFVSQQSSDTSTASTELATAQSYQTAVSSQLATGSGVNVDDQMGLMISLQNSYEANARVVQSAQTLFEVLFSATSATNPY